MDYKTGMNILTFEATALIGLQVGYSGKMHTIDDVKHAIRKASLEMNNYVFSGIITPTTILASGKKVNYEEPAVEIKSSIYPRFPVKKDVFKKQFTECIGRLAIILEQERATIRFTDESILIETKYCKKTDLK